TFGGKPFRELDDRSWDIARRLGDMDADGVAIQVLSPMPELLSYWLADDHSESLCDFVNGEVAAAVANRTDRFMGLGMVPMQQPRLAVRHLRRLRDQFGLAGVEIGSNVNGMMLGDARFDD